MFRFAQHDSGIQEDRSLLLRFVSDLENNFSTRVTGGDLFLRFPRFSKRKRLRNDYFDFLFVYQFADLGQLI